jgi:long-chain acyl-CoA synthetase
MQLHSLSDIYSLITEKRWLGKITESDRPESFFSGESAEELKKLTERLLLEGVAYGDRVILEAKPSLRTVIYLVSLWKIGATLVPIKHSTHPDKILPLAKDSNARFMIRPELDEVEKLESYLSIEQKFVFRIPPRVCGTDLALIIYSSGSTGVPKGIVLTHTNVLSALSSIVDYLELTKEDKILCVSPLSFDYGLYQIFFSFYTGCDVILFNEIANPLVILKAIDRYQISILPLVPSLASSLDRVLGIAKTTLPSLKKITNTGGHLLEPVIISLSKKLPQVKIYAMYGLTESKRVSYLPPQDLFRKLGSVGIPMPGLEAKVMKVLERDGVKTYVETEPFEPGLLFVRGSSVMQGYTTPNTDGTYLVSGRYRDDNWLCTNDLFYQDDEGYLFFKGREKDLIKQGGYCLYPKEIEYTISQNSAVVMAAVIGDRDIPGNEIAHCVIQLDAQNTSPSVRAKIIKWIDEKFDADYRPRKISFIDAIPLNENGKIDKRTLREHFGTKSLFIP